MIQKLEMGHFLVPPPKRCTSSRKGKDPLSHMPRDTPSSETLRQDGKIYLLHDAWKKQITLIFFKNPTLLRKCLLKISIKVFAMGREF